MVSGTQCPAWSDQRKNWSESRAAAPKGQCPVERKDDFPQVHPSVGPHFCTYPQTPSQPSKATIWPYLAQNQPPQ